MAIDNEINIPGVVMDAEKAIEVVRIWIADKRQIVALPGPIWEDPAVWGLMLVDLAKHVANTYEQLGKDRAQVLEHIHQAFQAEWDHPTDDPQRV